MNAVDITMSKEEKEIRGRQLIKHELQDYRFYLSKQETLEDKISRLDHKLNGGLSASGVASGGGVTCVASNSTSWITQALAEQEELQQEKGNIDQHVNKVESWLALLEEEVYKAVYLYVIINNCTNLEDCASELQMPSKRYLLRAIEKAIDVIYGKNF